jgi:hypothetical protein
MFSARGFGDDAYEGVGMRGLGGAQPCFANRKGQHSDFELNSP